MIFPQRDRAIVLVQSISPVFAGVLVEASGPAHLGAEQVSGTSVPPVE